MRIYTKTGDDATTGLSGGARVSKSSLRINALGDVDELNAHLGLCRLRSRDSIFELRLASIQTNLFGLGAELSCGPDNRKSYELLSLAEVLLLEESIDQQTIELTPLKNFVLPGGSELAAQLHIARAVCRRAERSVATLHEAERVREIVLMYLNRLSDWLFVAARTANHIENVEDIKWSVDS